MNVISSIRQMWAAQPSSLLTRADNIAGQRMSIPVAELRELNGSQQAAGTTEVQGAKDSFGGMLGQLVQDVNAKQLSAGQSVRDLQSGQNVSLHQTMISMEEASVSFQLMVEVRNKLLESYQELMRMQA
jgi:flagellar hook-basal body complex protein FliE